MENAEKLRIALETYIRPQTTPVAVALLKDRKAPERAKRPHDFFGYRMGLCQGFSFARRYGWATAFGIEDMACGPSLAYFGMIDRPEFEKDGGLVYPMYAKTLEAGKKSEDTMDILPKGMINMILIEPLNRLSRKPDVILIYCNAAQAARLIQGALYCEGGAITPTMSGRCACVPEVVTPYQKHDCSVTIPDGGERMFALTQDDELVFSVPYCKIADLVEGIETTHKSGVARYPFPPYGLRMRPNFPEKYDVLLELAEEEYRRSCKEDKNRNRRRNEMSKNTKVSIERDKDKLVREVTQSHFDVKPVYKPEDLEKISYEDIGDPGSYPFTRGLYPKMYRDRLWLKSFIVSYATPEETNAAYKSYIKNGLNDCRLLADLPTQSGIDPDHPAAWNSMMCGGVAHYALPVFETMLKDLPLEGVTYELAHSNVSSSIFCHSMILAMMEEQGLDTKKLRGNGICDPIRAKLCYESPDWPTEINRRVCMDHVEYSVRNTPKWKAVAPNGVDPQQGGMDLIREIGEVIAVSSVIIEDLEKRGLTIDDYGSMVVAMDAEIDFFETVCKFRAARNLWAKIAKEKFHAKTDRAMMLKIGVRTSGLSLQWQKPINNTARVTLETLAAVLGGVNSIDASSFDEAIGLPSNEARMFNLDMQQIITHEANIPLVADPLGGSYYVEALTNKIIKDVEAYLQEIQERGGIYECLESGWLPYLMEENRLRVQREKEHGEMLIIGVNSHKGEEGPINQAILNCAYKVPSEEMRQERVDEVIQFKKNRDYTVLDERFRRVYYDTKAGVNVQPSIIEALKAGMTMGEMVGIIRLAYGLCYDPMEMIPTPDYVERALKGCE